jgi:hypothetical protein
MAVEFGVNGTANPKNSCCHLLGRYVVFDARKNLLDSRNIAVFG